MNNKQIVKLYQSINEVSKKLNDYSQKESLHTNMRDDRNAQDITDTQDALIEVDEDRLQAQADAENALIELDEALEERLADIENALCEISEE